MKYVIDLLKNRLIDIDLDIRIYSKINDEYAEELVEILRRNRVTTELAISILKDVNKSGS